MISLREIRNDNIDRNAPEDPNACINHFKSSFHQNYAQPTKRPPHLTVNRKVSTIEGFDSRTIVFVYGLKKRLYCMVCCSLMETSPTKVGKHCKGKHLQNIGMATSAINKILQQNEEYIQQNADNHKSVDCLVCDITLREPSVTNLKKHLESVRHVAIVSQSGEALPGVEISPGEAPKKFAIQRENFKLRSMIESVKDHKDVEIMLDGDNIPKFFCKVCEKYLQGRSRHTVGRHIGSANHLKNEIDERTGEKLDDFLYRFFKIWAGVGMDFIMPFVLR